MKNYVVESYENYREEDRLTTNNARKIEFITTVRVFDKLFPSNSTILDCAAGTGVYAFHLAEKGHHITATDITPRHIEVIEKELVDKPYCMRTAVADATDLSAFEDEYFDIVLNMGPYYHLTENELRKKCLSECVRVLKKGGLLVTAYIPRYFVFQYVATSDIKYLDSSLANQIINTGVIRHNDEKCFWTDTYYSSKQEMENDYHNVGLSIVDHFSQDGVTPMLRDKIDTFNKEQFEIWCNYHYSICREESVLGASNHTIIIGRK